MTNVFNSEFSSYVEYLKNEGTGQNVAFNHTLISVNLNGLLDNSAQYNAARNALALWSKFTGLQFNIVSGSADITVDNTYAGAYATVDTSGSTITRSQVNVARDWYPNWSIGQYGVQTFIHEFGHALGLNHGGPYNGNGTYANDAIFWQDTWQYSVMSYFEQENYNGATTVNLIGPMIADIKAIQDLYGRISVNSGNTVYGRGETVISGWTDFSKYAYSTYCVNDTGGVDTLDYSNTSPSALIDLRAGYFSNINGLKGNVSIALGTVIENARGGAGNDSIIGNHVANVLQGNAGTDTIQGLDGNDSLYGGLARDYLYGGNGNDSLVGGAGNDYLNGGANIDTAYYSDSTVGLKASLLVPSQNTGIALGDTYVSIENIYGSAYGDTLVGDNFANTLWGANGNDYLYGNDGADALNGGSGNDYIVGGLGNDAIVGGAGMDRLFGSGGGDRFVFTATTDSTYSSAGRDVIYDFSYAAGDRIDLTLIDANTQVAGNQAFAYIGTAAFNGSAGQLHIDYAGGNTVVSCDVNGDRVADFGLTVYQANAISSLCYYL